MDKMQCTEKSPPCRWVPAGWFSKGRYNGGMSSPLNELSGTDVAELCARLDQLEIQRAKHGKRMEKSLELQLLHIRAVRTALVKDIDSQQQIDKMWAKYNKLKEGGKAQKQIGEDLGQLLVEESELCYALKNKRTCEKNSLHCSWVPAGWLSRGRCRGKIAEPIEKVSGKIIVEMLDRLKELEHQRIQHKKPMEKSLEWQLLYLRAVRTRATTIGESIDQAFSGARNIQKQLKVLEKPNLTREERGTIIRGILWTMQSIQNALWWIIKHPMLTSVFSLLLYWGCVNCDLAIEIWDNQPDSQNSWQTIKEFLNHEQLVSLWDALGGLFLNITTFLGRCARWIGVGAAVREGTVPLTEEAVIKASRHMSGHTIDWLTQLINMCVVIKMGRTGVRAM